MRPVVWIGITLFGVIAVVLLVTFVYLQDPDRCIEERRNVTLRLNDRSLNEEDPSLLLTIDDTLVFNYDSLSADSFPHDSFFLNTGIHKVEVQTNAGLFAYSDTLRVNDLKTDYVLTIRFNYQPPLSWYKEYISGYMYSDQLKIKGWPRDTSVQWLHDSVASCANNSDFDYYVPGERHFSIQFGPKELLE